jgi:hypothetical protein
MVKRCLSGLALAACLSASAVSVGAPAAADTYQAWRAGAAAALIARGDAKSLATAAALRYGGSPNNGKAGGAQAEPSAPELAARASDLASQDPSIGWLHLQLCAGTPNCDIRDVATAMRWIDADNGAAWLQTLAIAQRDRDIMEVDRILSDMARGARFDFYWNRIVVLMVDALEAARKDIPSGYAGSVAARLNTASGLASGEIIPPFRALAEACREVGAAPERRELCLKLSKTMQRADTIVAQMMGFSIEKHLLAPDSREARAVAERRHVLEWRMAAAAKFDTPVFPWLKNARARERLARMRALPREEDVCIAILREHKVAIDPPEAHL